MPICVSEERWDSQAALQLALLSLMKKSASIGNCRRTRTDYSFGHLNMSHGSPSHAAFMIDLKHHFSRWLIMMVVSSWWSFVVSPPHFARCYQGESMGDLIMQKLQEKQVPTWRWSCSHLLLGEGSQAPDNVCPRLSTESRFNKLFRCKQKVYIRSIYHYIIIL